ncbi:hypothetical protein DRO64_04920 [Candidatus Bathyarchaeota archaeon]|nr:MAG: hypothetical protein DRO64_04920 [Candidatus Bathyarchaeota archaeon]
MARIYDVVCPRCGEIMQWCKYDSPFDRCGFCNYKLSWGECWKDDVCIFGVGATNLDVWSVANSIRRGFFDERPRGFRFGLPDRRICAVKMRDYRTYTFTVKAGGVKVTFVYDTCHLAPVAERLREDATLPLQDLAEIIYRGTSYPRNRLIARRFVEAVRLNVKPEHVALIGEHM